MRVNWFFLHSVFDDLRVDAGHSIDSMRSHNAQVSHVDFLDIPFLDKGHSAQTVNISRVKLGDALVKGQRYLFSHSTHMHIQHNIISTPRTDFSTT